MNNYNPKEIEPKWQKIWEDNKTYQAADDVHKKKMYATPMLPYPSGTGLHTGHVRNYSITDAVARYYRQNGYNTLTTIAWDSFGLPAENFAIKTGTPPAESTAKNIAYFKQQLQSLGMSYDWSREFNTSDPSYYKWTQWVFTQLYKQGLAYQAEKPQWWCDQCKTVLADEQVVAGKCWRHDGENDPLVTKRNLRQWFFKITHYADELLQTTDALDWPEKIKSMQKNWIGKSEGTVVQFALNGLGSEGQHLDVFTTAVETIFGATFMVVAPEHPIVSAFSDMADNAQHVQDYVIASVRKSDITRESEKVKTGVPIEGLFALHPLTGKQVPVWVADYVLMGYGSGAIMAVPGGDARDFAFATKYDLPVIYTTDKNEFVDYGEEVKHNKSAYIMANSGEYDGQTLDIARQAIVDALVQKKAGETKVQFKIRDWLISRQRYWGAPVPIIHCETHGAVAVPENMLPVELPHVDSYAPDGTNHSVLAGVSDWVNTTCPTCGGPAKRETDVLDGYVCSSWYLYRYTDAHNDKQAFDPQKVAHWFPLDFYFGADHAVAHLLHIRFLHRAFIDGGIIAMQDREPVKRLVFNGYINAEDGSKMSKSKGNTVDPMDIIKSGYGADALRVFELFIAPYDQDTPWNTKGVPGTYRFLNRVWVLVQEYMQAPTKSDTVNNTEVLRIAHKTVKKVTIDLQNLSFNTAVAAMMDMTNQLYLLKAREPITASSGWKYAVASLVQLLGPFAPHIAEELWSQLGNSGSVHIDQWPTYDDSLLVEDSATIAVQVNGKVRGEITFASTASKEEVVALGMADVNVQKFLENKEPTKTIYVPGRILNFVV
ncbi:leucine--tRNA ligase [bacterium]|nr:leucine--tRNA ligase [bacterium]NBX98600.1 leucine--tRNA ligase [bacterium]NDC94693.1 leucine--tRNA ligase [bacterium]NDD84223.1 leucine--tRNA ligase [bacterium]NDG30140.1 leucine--tRNA ligase [bacterium]